MKEFRTGIGIDIHAFEDPNSNYNHTTSNQKIKIGGIEISFNRAIKAHSDGDLLLHALTDALLGAIGAGDIGEHFPDSNPKWKDIDSTKILSYAIELLKRENWNISNLDSTIICEKPRISPYKEKIKQKIATLLSIETDRVNIKATTSEKMGFLGRGEGIAAFVTCCVYRK